LRQQCERLLWAINSDPQFDLEAFPVIFGALEMQKMLARDGLYSNLPTHPLYPKANCIEVINCLEKLKLPRPYGLLKMVREIHDPNLTDQASSISAIVTKTLNPKTKSSMQILINAMARSKPLLTIQRTQKMVQFLESRWLFWMLEWTCLNELSEST